MRREADALRMAELDDLTGLGNYRMFMRQLTAEVARSRRYDDPFSLVMLDLDGFKAINDELGHLAGDDALRLVAVALRDALREEDVCCRQGGDEFAVIAVRAGEQEAHELAERLTRAIARDPVRRRRRTAPRRQRRLGDLRRAGAQRRRADPARRRRAAPDASAPTAVRRARRRARRGASRGGRGPGTDTPASAPTRRIASRCWPGSRGRCRARATSERSPRRPSRSSRAPSTRSARRSSGSIPTGACGRGRQLGRRDDADVVGALASHAIVRRAVSAAGPAVVEDGRRAGAGSTARTVQSELAVAVREESRTWGYLLVCSDRPHAYELSERALAEAIAEQLGRALSCRRLLDRLREAGFGELYRVAVGERRRRGHRVVADRRAGVAGRAARSGSSDEDLRALYLAALFHDVGTVGVPAVLMSHPGELRDEERAVLREHALIGERMLRGCRCCREAAPIVRHEHERFDGTGYPDRLAGEQIPLAARILLACDVFVSMTSPRPWRPPRSTPSAHAELRRVAGAQLDPRVVDALLGSSARRRRRRPAHALHPPASASSATSRSWRAAPQPSTPSA